MKKNITAIWQTIIVFVLLMQFIQLWGQQTNYGLPGYSTGQNYVSTRIYQKPTTKEPIKDVTDVIDQVQYVDGLGRPIQSIMVSGSPSQNDIVQPIGYDAFDREATKYLPYTQSRGGAFDSYAIKPVGGDYTSSNQYWFYHDNEGIGVPTDDNPFAQILFEPSPLNRVLEHGAPGTDWQPGTGHTVKINYFYNSTNEVKLWIIINDSVCSQNGNYNARQLYVTQTTDENQHLVKEYKDKDGQVILKKTYNGSDSLQTYYIYDDYKLLRYVIPPKAATDLSITSLNPSSPLTKKLCFYYQYDDRQRMSLKQIPGVEKVYMVYDDRDRLVLTQDGKMRAENNNRQWHFTKYDELNRPVLTGMITYSTAFDQGQMQQQVNNANAVSRRYFVTRNNINNWLLGYSDDSYPKSTDGTIEFLTATYYNTYGYPGCKAFDANHNLSDYNDGDTNPYYFDRLNGQITGTYISGSDGSVVTTLYYDDKYRDIQILRDIVLPGGGTETVSIKYDFAGRVLQTKTEQALYTNDFTVNKYYTYDHAGRLLKTDQQIDGDNDNGRVTLSENMYNELGQFWQKKLHKSATMGNYLQTVNYNHNIRGWLDSINNPNSLGSDLFSMQLLYNDKSALSNINLPSQYNGNISGMIWKTSYNNTTSKAGYGFTYDALNRLTASLYAEGESLTASSKYKEYDIQYDLNGNLNQMKRTNCYGNVMDNMSYAYANAGKSNLLTYVSNGASPRNYLYDANGNMTVQNDVSIQYNYLNLPVQMNNPEDNYNSWRIGYNYDATGRKTSKVNFDLVDNYHEINYYEGVFEYYYHTDYTPDPILTLIHTDEGVVRCTFDENTSTYQYSYEYFLKDHLGNTRVSFKKGTGNTPIVLQCVNYYPFGLSQNPVIPNSDNKYLYNGKELQGEMGWYDYGARFYDPKIGRWTTPDPIANLMTSFSCYSYAFNNPVRLIDIGGLIPSNPGGLTPTPNGMQIEDVVISAPPVFNPFIPKNYNNYNWENIRRIVHVRNNNAKQQPHTSYIFQPRPFLECLILSKKPAGEIHNLAHGAEVLQKIIHSKALQKFHHGIEFTGRYTAGILIAADIAECYKSDNPEEVQEARDELDRECILVCIGEYCPEALVTYAIGAAIYNSPETQEMIKQNTLEKQIKEGNLPFYNGPTYIGPK